MNSMALLSSFIAVASFVGFIYFVMRAIEIVRSWAGVHKKPTRKFRADAGTDWRTDRQLIHWMRSMEPTEFEEFVAQVMIKLGYEARVIGGAYDGGIDVIAIKDGVEHFVQCKKFITQKVTVGALRDFYGALADRIADGQGIFITTNVFTLEARHFAEDKPIELVDCFQLVKYLRLAYQDHLPDMPPVATKLPEQCPDCGKNLVRKAGKYGEFLGCSNFPGCMYTRSI